MCVCYFEMKRSLLHDECEKCSKRWKWLLENLHPTTIHPITTAPCSHYSLSQLPLDDYKRIHSTQRLVEILVVDFFSSFKGRSITLIKTTIDNFLSSKDALCSFDEIETSLQFMTLNSSNLTMVKENVNRLFEFLSTSPCDYLWVLCCPCCDSSALNTSPHSPSPSNNYLLLADYNKHLERLFERHYYRSNVIFSSTNLRWAIGLSIFGPLYSNKDNTIVELFLLTWWLLLILQTKNSPLWLNFIHKEEGGLKLHDTLDQCVCILKNHHHHQGGNVSIFKNKVTWLISAHGKGEEVNSIPTTLTLRGGGGEEEFQSPTLELSVHLVYFSLTKKLTMVSSRFLECLLIESNPVEDVERLASKSNFFMTGGVSSDTEEDQEEEEELYLFINNISNTLSNLILHGCLPYWSRQQFNRTMKHHFNYLETLSRKWKSSSSSPPISAFETLSKHVKPTYQCNMGMVLERVYLDKMSLFQSISHSALMSLQSRGFFHFTKNHKNQVIRVQVIPQWVIFGDGTLLFRLLDTQTQRIIHTVKYNALCVDVVTSKKNDITFESKGDIVWKWNNNTLTPTINNEGSDDDDDKKALCLLFLSSLSCLSSNTDFRMNDYSIILNELDLCVGGGKITFRTIYRWLEKLAVGEVTPNTSSSHLPNFHLCHFPNIPTTLRALLISSNNFPLLGFRSLTATMTSTLFVCGRFSPSQLGFSHLFATMHPVIPNCYSLVVEYSDSVDLFYSSPPFISGLYLKIQGEEGIFSLEIEETVFDALLQNAILIAYRDYDDDD